MQNLQDERLSEQLSRIFGRRIIAKSNAAMPLSKPSGKPTSVSQRGTKCCVIGFIIIVTFLLYLLVTIKMKGSVLTKLYPENVCIINRNSLQKDLELLHSQITFLQKRGNAPVSSLLVKVEHMMEALNIPIPRDHGRAIQLFQGTSALANSTVFDVCPEKYMGTRYGYMYYVTGWVMEDCEDVRPMEKVISVVLNPFIGNRSGACLQNLERIIRGIRSNYSYMNIIIPEFVVRRCPPELRSEVIRVPISEQWRPGLQWNALVNSVRTPYVFIGRDLDYFVGWLSRLERQIRVIGAFPSVAIAGGSVRNLTGHWRVGCYQSEMKNYVLTYEDGYYASKNECMYCDHLMGPFVARTQLFREVPFSVSLDKEVVFEDFFIRVRREHYLIMNCPDVMYLASDDTVTVKERQKEAWLSLVRRWELNRIALPNNRVFGYSCEESGLQCKRFLGTDSSFLIPPCCIEQYVKAMTVFHEFCLKNKLYYEFDAGSVLGLLKMSDYLPWDYNGVVKFHNSNLTFFKESAPYFAQYGIRLGNFEKRDEHTSTFKYFTPDFYNEFSGEANLSKDVYEPEIFRDNPTKANLHGTWVYAPVSPGLYARNRYGTKMLHHANEWLHMGIKTSWELNSELRFPPCKIPEHHACLDQFLEDGNLQFKIPQPR